MLTPLCVALDKRRRTGRAREIVPHLPPLPYTPRPRAPERETSNMPAPVLDSAQACPICLTKAKDLAFGCGHMTCGECGSNLNNCPICGQRITNRLRLFD